MTVIPTQQVRQRLTLHSSKNSEGTTNNTVSWQSGQTSVWFVVRFTAAGSNRVFDVGSLEASEFADTDLSGFTVLPKPTLNVTYSPNSTSYTVGQSVTATMTGGIVGEMYYPSLYNGTVSDANDISQHLLVQGVQNPGNAVVWSETTTSGQWIIGFTSAATGTNRKLGISNRDFSHEQISGPLTILCPPVSISATPGLTIESGSSVTLTASGTDSYTWSTGVKSASLVLTDVTSATTLSVTGVTGQCSATATATVNMAAPPLSATVVASQSQVCANTSFVVSATASGGEPPYRYDWIQPDGAMSIASENSLTVSTGVTGGQTFSVMVYDATDAFVSSNVVSVTVNALPPVSISAMPALAVIPGNSVTLTASGADSYTWSSGVLSPAVVLTNVTSATTLSVTGTTGECTAIATAAVSLSCDQTIIADAVSITQTTALGPDNCSVQLTGTGFGTGYTITGPNGYVFSTVYRRIGSYAINGLNVKQPGEYTFSVSYQNNCGEVSTDTMTYVVTGTACK